MIIKSIRTYNLYILLLWSILLCIPSLSFSQESSKKLTLLFVGDIMGHTPQIKSAEIIKNRSYNYKPCFEYVAPLLREADLAIGNLEVTLPGSPPYSGYPIFRSPDDLARDLKWAGFDVLLTANNHSNDGHKKGVIHTIETLREEGIHQTGTFKNRKERDLFYPLIVHKNGFKLAFLNYTYGTNNISTKPPTIVNGINPYMMQKDIKKAKKLKPDAIIAVLHWGEEYQLIENQEQRKVADWLANKGVDLVIGAHPHVVQPIIQKNKDSKKSINKTLIAYSLGNFVSNQDQPNTTGGIMLEVELTKSMASQKTQINNYHFIPVWRHIQNNKQKNKKATYHVLPISALQTSKRLPIRLSKEESLAMKQFARVTRARLRHHGAKEKRVTWSEIFEKKVGSNQLSLKK